MNVIEYSDYCKLGERGCRLLFLDSNGHLQIDRSIGLTGKIARAIMTFLEERNYDLITVMRTLQSQPSYSQWNEDYLFEKVAIRNGLKKKDLDNLYAGTKVKNRKGVDLLLELGIETHKVSRDVIFSHSSQATASTGFVECADPNASIDELYEAKRVKSRIEKGAGSAIAISMLAHIVIGGFLISSGVLSGGLAVLSGVAAIGLLLAKACGQKIKLSDIKTIITTILVLLSAPIIGEPLLLYSLLLTVVSSLVLAYSTYSYRRKISEIPGTIDSHSASHMNFWKKNDLMRAAMLPTKHSADTHAWRKKLIREAKHNIVISGNYCGDEQFDEVLDLIKERMEKNNELKVVILSSPKFVKNKKTKKRHFQNKTKIKSLTQKFPDRFSLVYNPDVFMYGSTIKKSTNHVKYTGIDYGKYYILGGSGIKENFSFSGVEDPLSLIEGFDSSQLQNEIEAYKSRFTTFSNQVIPHVHFGWANVLRSSLPMTLTINQFDASKRDTLDREITSFIADTHSILANCEASLQILRSNEALDTECKTFVTHLENLILKLGTFNQVLITLQAALRSSDQEITEAIESEFQEHVASCLALINPKIKVDRPISFTTVVQEFLSENGTFIKGILIPTSPQINGSAPDDLVSWLIPGNFRDQDFLFGEPEYRESSQGRKLFLQMLLLAYRWEQYTVAKDGKSEIPLYSPSEVANFAAFVPRKYRNSVETIPLNENDSVTISMLKDPMKRPNDVQTTFEDFDSHVALDPNGEIKLFFSGPEQPNNTSEFRKEALQLIRLMQSGQEIVINHMYFHPTTDLQKALAEAAERGVRITLITTGIHPNCPNGQKMFSPRNKYNYVDLLNRISEENKRNVEIYTYHQKKIGLHKKVIVFDGEYVLAGSSNFGYKSLVTTSDHEVNFLAKSKKFAEETLKVCRQDIRVSDRVENPTLSFSEKRKAANHRIMAPLVG